MRFSTFTQKALRRWHLHVHVRPWLRKLWLRFQGARIGAGTILPRLLVTWPHQVAIGRRCTLEEDIFFKFDGVWQPGPSIVIGDHVFLGRGCEFNICKAITIGNHCAIASGCKFIDHDHGIPPIDQLIGPLPGPEYPIRLEENVWLGANVIVLKGVTIGRGAIVGAGAVVVKDVPPFEIWGGVPARKLGQRPRSHEPGLAPDTELLSASPLTHA
jgi:acetyltransferase-like isoleucine patch superfamily enzyme